MGKQRKINSKTIFAASLKVTRRPNKTSDRERERVRGLSRAFSRLKTTLPWVPADTKLSKLDTLKLASWYISYLVNLLKKDQEQSRDNCNRDANSHSESLVSEKLHDNPIWVFLRDSLAEFLYLSATNLCCIVASPVVNFINFMKWMKLLRGCAYELQETIEFQGSSHSSVDPGFLKSGERGKGAHKSIILPTYSGKLHEKIWTGELVSNNLISSVV